MIWPLCYRKQPWRGLNRNISKLVNLLIKLLLKIGKQQFVSYNKILSVMLHNNSRLGLLARFFRHHHHHSITARVLNFVRKTYYFMDSSASSRLLFWKMKLQTFKYASLIWIDGATISNMYTYLGIAVAKFSISC